MTKFFKLTEKGLADLCPWWPCLQTGVQPALSLVEGNIKIIMGWELMTRGGNETLQNAFTTQGWHLPVCLYVTAPEMTSPWENLSTWFPAFLTTPCCGSRVIRNSSFKSSLSASVAKMYSGVMITSPPSEQCIMGIRSAFRTGGSSFTGNT